MRTRCRTDFALFGDVFLPRLCRLPWNPLHRHLFASRMQKTAVPPPGRRGRTDVVLAPRGAAKSSIVSLLFPIHALAYELDPYIVIISATQRQASRRLANLRDVLADSPELAAHYPLLTRVSRRSERSMIVGGARIDAFSAGSELRGVTHGAWRPTWIILDDVESSSRIHSSAYREGLAEWMNEVIENLGNGYTNIDLIGTLLHPEALPARLAGRPDVRSRVFRSIRSEPARDDLWDRWRAGLFDLANPSRLEDARAFYDANREAMDEGARVLWPAKESHYDLQLLRARIGRRAFDKEKQNCPPEDGESLLPVTRRTEFTLSEGRIELRPGTTPPASLPPHFPLSDLRVFGFLDPALGEGDGRGRGSRGDFAALVTVGLDRHGYLFVLDAWLERAAPSAQIDRAWELHERWNYELLGIETNAFQKMLLPAVEEERARRRARGARWDLPVRGVRHRAGKRMRILALEPLLRNGWLLFSDRAGGEFIRQLADFPSGRHDDGPDALAAAVELARRASTRASVASVPRAVERARGPGGF